MIRNERANATIQTLFLTLQLSSLRLLLSFSTRKPQYVHGLSCYSFKLPYRTVPSKPPTIPYGIVACTFSDLSRNSCIQNELSTRGTGSLTYDTPGNAWVYERRTETHILLRTKMCDFPRSYFRARNILGHPGADSGGEGKSKRAEKCATKKSKERRPFFTFLRAASFRLFRLSLVPTICPWVFEDEVKLAQTTQLHRLF